MIHQPEQFFFFSNNCGKYAFTICTVNNKKNKTKKNHTHSEIIKQNTETLGQLIRGDIII